MDWFPITVLETTIALQHLVAMFLIRKKKSTRSFNQATDALFEQ